MQSHLENRAERAADSPEIEIQDVRLLAGQPGQLGEDDPAVCTDDLGVNTCIYDRDAMAAFMLDNGPHIRRRVRGKLGVIMRRSVDSEDILSTVIRRLDRYAASNQIRATTENELWALVLKITDAAIVDKIRKKERQRRLDEGGLLKFGVDGSSEASIPAISDCDEKQLVESIFSKAANSSNKTDEVIMMLWARGLSHSSIAVVIEQKVSEVRSRWQLIKRRLRR